MARPLDTPEGEARRLRGWELFLDAGPTGKRRSMRSIALELGVHPHTVEFWRKKDEWDAKLDEKLAARAEIVGAKAEAVTELLQSSLGHHVLALNKVIRMAQKDADKIKAIIAFVDIYRKLGVPLTPSSQGRPLTFTDDMGEPPSEPDLAFPREANLDGGVSTVGLADHGLAGEPPAEFGDGA